MDEPTFPEFALDEFFWVTAAPLPSFGGLGLGTSDGLPAGSVRIVYAPEGRDESPLTEEEIARVRWLVEHEAEVHAAVTARLFEEYPTIRAEFLEDFEHAQEAATRLPEVGTLAELEALLGVDEINVHPLEKDGLPFVGVELRCAWEEEHGVGVLLHGTRVLEVGDADTAILLWIAKKHVTEP
jgi:hypothetical protein